MSAHALREVGLFEELNMYIARMGWEGCVLVQYPTYVQLTCEFLSSFHFDENSLLMTFHLGNREHTMGMLEFNDAYNFPLNQNAMVQFNRDEFWAELTSQRNAIYEA